MAESNRGCRLRIVTELYYPEETSTGYVLTRIAEGLSVTCDVSVICGQPTYSARGRRAAGRELHNGVQIRRCWGTTWNKDVLPLRIVNLLTLSFSIFFNLIWRLRRGDVVLVVTNPPSLPILVAATCKLRRAKCLLLVHDVYPDVVVAAGMQSSNSLLVSLMQLTMRRVYKCVDQIIVLGRDMKELVCERLPFGREKVVVVTNWSDLDLVQPRLREGNQLLRSLGIQDKFVVQYAGNMGRSHNLEAIVDCASRLESEADIHFLLIGSGAKKAWLEKSVRDWNLTNVTILNRLPRSELPDLLNACDVSVISLVSGMSGVSVPSRIYNVLAAGKPIVALSEPRSELAAVVEEEKVGWLVSPHDIDAFCQAVLEARSDSEQLKAMGLRARAAAEEKYSFDRTMRSFRQLIGGLDTVESHSARHAA